MELAREIQRLGCDVGNEVWQWLVQTGPHGRGFTWSQTRKEPAGDIGVEHLQRIVTEKQEVDSNFPAEAKTVIGKALLSANVEILRRAI